ncbi:MAG: FAD-binding protein [Gemmatimonadales bacterium]
MSNTIAASIAAAIGPDAVRTDVGGRIISTPPSIEALARLLGLAYDGGWSVALTGAGTWQTNDAPATVTISTRALDEVIRSVRPKWTVAVQAGASLDAIARFLGSQGAGLHIDPPGRADRSIGSVLATGTLGPISFPLINQIEALAVVTGDGRIIRIDRGHHNALSLEEQLRPHIGGFGAFGVIAEVEISAREAGHPDQTFVTVGDRDRLTAAARDFEEVFLGVCAAEVLSPALAAQPEWMLAVRHRHNGDSWHAVAREAAMARSPGLAWRELAPAEASQLWNSSARAMSSAPVTFRLAATSPGFDETLDLVIARMGEGVISATPYRGAVRWCGEATPEQLRLLRIELAAREIPLTIERAPWAIRSALGHLGMFHEGVGGVVDRLRESFDPGGILSPALLPAEPGS